MRFMVSVDNAMMMAIFLLSGQPANSTTPSLWGARLGVANVITQ